MVGSLSAGFAVVASRGDGARRCSFVAGELAPQCGRLQGTAGARGYLVCVEVGIVAAPPRQHIMFTLLSRHLFPVLLLTACPACCCCCCRRCVSMRRPSSCCAPLPACVLRCSCRRLSWRQALHASCRSCWMCCMRRALQQRASRRSVLSMPYDVTFCFSCQWLTTACAARIGRCGDGCA